MVDNYADWQVEIGCYRRVGENVSPIWNTCAFGCIVRSRVVVTLYQVISEVEQVHCRDSGMLVRIAGADYDCSIGHFDKDRNLAVLVLAKPAKAPSGKVFAAFPELAKTHPVPGQHLGVLSMHTFPPPEGSLRNPPYFQHYVCLSFGHVALLQTENRSLHALYGAAINPNQFGNAVFDANGVIHGITTQCLPSTQGRPHETPPTQFLIFTPIWAMASATTGLVLESATDPQAVPVKATHDLADVNKTAS